MVIRVIAVTLFAIVLLANGKESSSPRILFQEDFGKGLNGRWRKVEFTTDTQYAMAKEGTNQVLRATAQQSASGLATQIDVDPDGKLVLKWRWKIDKIPPGGSDKEIKRFDHTARLFVAFKSLIGPPRTVNYVWGNTVKSGQSFHHPNSGRARFIVLEDGNKRAGEWIEESRDLLADWRLLFGSDDAPQIVGIGLMTDSDGTKSTVTGCYDDIILMKQ
jgi:hypothetical protein